MTDIVQRLRSAVLFPNIKAEAADQIERLRDFVSWVDIWVSNPVGSYSVHSLDGLFGITRDKIEALRRAGAVGGPAND